VSIILAIVISAAAIQLGYLAGILIRAAVGERSYYRTRNPPDCTVGEKPMMPSVMVRLARVRLEQRSGSQPLEPSEQRRSTGRKEVETGQRSEPASARRGPG
jgi:hypothetical protein